MNHMDKCLQHVCVSLCVTTCLRIGSQLYRTVWNNFYKKTPVMVSVCTLDNKCWDHDDDQHNAMWPNFSGFGLSVTILYVSEQQGSQAVSSSN